MMKIVIFIAIVVTNYIPISQGIICSICIGLNAANCRLNEKLVECATGQICATTIRRNGIMTSVVKRCQQRKACFNEQKQNWLTTNSEAYKCNNNQRQSTCHCCCVEDRCQGNEACVGAAVNANSQTRCSKLPEPFRYGTRRCSRGNQVGSTCRVRCNSDYVLNPSYSEEITCQPNGKWNMPLPCCSLPCPPHLYIDLVVLIHFHDHRIFLRTTTNQFAALARRVVVGPNGLRFASPHYDSRVHTPYISFRDTANITSEELLNLSIIEAENSDTDPSIVNTGAALWHVHNNLFNTEYDRQDAKNVLIFLTDRPSDDDVSAPARALRESGVTIYSHYFKTDGGIQPTDEEFVEISGFEDQTRIITPDRTAADVDFFANLCPNTCNIL